MKTIKISAAALTLALMVIGDIPILPMELLPEAHAIFGVRRRTAVIAYSAGAASGAAAAKASAPQQQAAPAPQQPAAPPPQPTSAIPVGTIVEKVPAGAAAVTVGNVSYQESGGVFYRSAFQGNKLVYVVVERPM